MATAPYGSPTVHDRGRGYSNSSTLCRGRTLPQHSINPSGQPWATIHEYADNQSSPIRLLTLVPALLYEFGLPTTENLRLGNCIEVQISLFCTGKQRLTHGHEGTHTKVSKLRIKPYPYQVLWCTFRLGDRHSYSSSFLLKPTKSFHQSLPSSHSPFQKIQ